MLNKKTTKASAGDRQRDFDLKISLSQRKKTNKKGGAKQSRFSAERTTLEL